MIKTQVRLMFPCVMLGILFIAGCGGSSGGIAGTWELDRTAMSQAFQRSLETSGIGIPPEARQMIAAMVESMDWTVTLDENGAAAFRIEEDGSVLETSGGWTLDGSILKIEYFDHRDRTVELIGVVTGGQITLEASDTDAPPIVMTRSKRAALVVEVPPPVPPMGPLRAGCPPTMGAAPTGGGQVDDIRGLRPGMPYDDVLALLECRNDIRVIQTAPLFSITENYGIPTRQLIRASDGIPCSEREARGDRCSTLGRFGPLRDISHEYVIAFTGMPGEEIARAVWVRSVYDEQDGQAGSVLAEGLAEKYGTPQLQAVGDNMRINHVRRGATNIVWLFNQDGSPAPPPTSQFSSASINWDTCVNGPNPSFSARQGWSSGCHLTIRAELVPQQGNTLLVHELNMVVMNQRDLYHAGRQFESALRTVSDERLRRTSGRPDL